MIDSIFNLLFKCQHRRLSRPMTPVSKRGVPRAGTYVVCFDCGKHFTYDLQNMRVGPPVDLGEPAPRPVVEPRKPKLKLAVFTAAVPLAWLIGSGIHSSRKHKGEQPPKDKPESK